MPTLERRQFMRYGSFEGHMCEQHRDYLAWLWSSDDVSCLTSLSGPLRSARHAPPSDSVHFRCCRSRRCLLRCQAALAPVHLIERECCPVNSVQ